MQQENIRAVFLDAGNTLFTDRTSRPAVYAKFASAHGGTTDTEAMTASMQRAFHDLPSSLEGHYRYSLAWFRAFNERVLGEAGVTADAQEAAHEELLRHFLDPGSYRLFDEVPEVLEALTHRGVRIGVVSNWSEHLPELLEGLGVSERIDFVVTSADLRTEKPDRAIFERALFRAGAAAAETLHVGDCLERDVRGALNAGLRAAWVDRDGLRDEAASDGIPVLSDLLGLLELLDPQAQSAR